MALCFSVMFYKRVGRPNGSCLLDVELAYDRRWGCLEKAKMRDVIDSCSILCEQTSIRRLLPLVLPAHVHANECIGELILWAVSYGHVDCPWCRRRDPAGIRSKGVISLSEWPQLTGPYPLLKAWKDRGTCGS